MTPPWETPRRVAILAAAVAIVSAGVGGTIGFELGRHPPAPQVIIIQTAAAQ